MIWELDNMERRICEMAKRIWLEGHHSLAKRPNDSFCGHLIVDKVKDPLEIVKMLRRFGIHNMVV